MVDLCVYKDIFGKPGEGVHSLRFMNIAVVDMGLTLAAAYLLSHYTTWTFIESSIGLLGLGFVMHWLFCVETTLTKSFL